MRAAGGSTPAFTGALTLRAGSGDTPRRHLQTVELPSYEADYPLHAIFGEVVGVHIADDCIVDGRVDFGRTEPIGRLGYMDYVRVTDTFEMVLKEMEVLTKPDNRV